MPFQVFDWRKDLRNLIVTPEIRGRFLRFEPHENHLAHSHDLGHEIFLILDGQCEMEIDGHRELLGPGQVCYAYAHQMHVARNVGDTPMTMYLSVTPHIEPTHTHYNQATGERLPPRYNRPTAFDQPDTLAETPSAELADTFLAAAQALTAVIQDAATRQGTAVEALKQAADSGGRPEIAAAMDALWSDVYATLRAVSVMSAAWNDLAPRATKRT